MANPFSLHDRIECDCGGALAPLSMPFSGENHCSCKAFANNASWTNDLPDTWIPRSEGSINITVEDKSNDSKAQAPYIIAAGLESSRLNAKYSTVLELNELGCSVEESQLLSEGTQEVRIGDVAVQSAKPLDGPTQSALESTQEALGDLPEVLDIGEILAAPEMSMVYDLNGKMLRLVPATSFDARKYVKTFAPAYNWPLDLYVNAEAKPGDRYSVVPHTNEVPQDVAAAEWKRVAVFCLRYRGVSVSSMYSLAAVSQTLWIGPIEGMDYEDQLVSSVGLGPTLMEETMPELRSADLTAANTSIPKVTHCDPHTELLRRVIQADLEDSSYANIDVPGRAWPLIHHSIGGNEGETSTPEKRDVPAVPIAKFGPSDPRGYSEHELPRVYNQELFDRWWRTVVSDVDVPERGIKSSEMSRVMIKLDSELSESETDGGETITNTNVCGQRRDAI